VCVCVCVCMCARVCVCVCVCACHCLTHRCASVHGYKFNFVCLVKKRLYEAGFSVILLLQLFARFVLECHPRLCAARVAYSFAVSIPKPQNDAVRMVKIIALQAS